MFALLVLGITIAVLAGTLIAAMHADSNNQIQNTALFLANQEADQIVAQYRAMSTPCAPGSCGSFTDISGATVNLNDNLNSAAAGEPIPAPSFSGAGASGYSATAWVGPNCTGSVQSGCQEYELRWNIYTPQVSYTLGGNTQSSAQAAHLICVAAEAVTGVASAPVEVYAAAQ